MTLASEGGHHVVRRLAALLTVRRLTAWGTGLLVLSWFIYIHTIATPGLVDRAGRFKGADYIQFYVMGSMVREHRADALYDPEAHLQIGRDRIDSTLRFYAPKPNYPPQFAFVFAPLSMLPYSASLALFELLSVVCYGLAVWLVWRECRSLRRHPVLVAVLAAASPALFTVLRYGQASAFALLIWSIVFVALEKNRPVLAGIALGCLAYKPQLALVPAVALLAGREWRASIAAAACVAIQFAAAWAVAGSRALGEYALALWSLALNPDAVVMYPSEVHSIRGFVRLIAPSPSVAAAATVVGGIVLLGAAIRAWRAAAPLPLRWSALAVATVLASPHMLTYDLLLLTLPMLVAADWAIAHRDDSLWPAVCVLLGMLYFCPFSANFARFSAVQLSVPVMLVFLWRLGQVCGLWARPAVETAPGRADTWIVAPRPGGVS